MILKEVKLEHFKAAYKPDPIPLQAFNVLIGRNGSGKSTLLEALQWLDVTIRRDAREACDRYFGMRDLVNLRSQTNAFGLGLDWEFEVGKLLGYRAVVGNHDSLPVIESESMTLYLPDEERVLIRTQSRGSREIETSGSGGQFTSVDAPERLVLSAAMIFKPLQLEALDQFWSRAVFLRLSPNRLANGSSAVRKSFDPILDEEGQTLPALLHELTADQREELAEQLKSILPGIRGVEISKAEAGRDTKVHYSLTEEIPNHEGEGQTEFAIPAWMLSEGTRRITAILALLLREPAPTLLCIEEIENGLDPWTVIEILRHLQSAADRGTQVILTTHSPWLLDHVPMESILQVRRIDGDTKYERFCERPEIQAYHANVPAGTRYINEA